MLKIAAMVSQANKKKIFVFLIGAVTSSLIGISLSNYFKDKLSVKLISAEQITSKKHPNDPDSEKNIMFGQDFIITNDGSFPIKDFIISVSGSGLGVPGARVSDDLSGMNDTNCVHVPTEYDPTYSTEWGTINWKCNLLNPGQEVTFWLHGSGINQLYNGEMHLQILAEGLTYKKSVSF